MRRFTLLTAVPLLVACGEQPTATELSPLEAQASFSVLGRSGGAVTLPVKLDARVVWTVPGATPADCPGLIDPATGELFMARGTGRGEATHLGRFSITKFDHPSINLCSIIGSPPAPPTVADVTRTGSFEFSGADGTTLFGTYSFFFTGVPGTGYFNMTVAGGSGRLAGATGYLEYVFEESGNTQFSDLLGFSAAVLDPMVFEGEVTVPKPGAVR